MQTKFIVCLIKNCKTTNSSGLDGLSNNLLKVAGPVISDFLAVIFDGCILVVYFRKILKIARIEPFFKAGGMQNPENYRPISLLSSLSKSFEIIVVTTLKNLCEKGDVLNSKQCGFRKKVNIERADCYNRFILGENYQK